MIPWDIPTSDEEIPRLTHIYRNQHFLVWLAAMDLESKVELLTSSMRIETWSFLELGYLHIENSGVEKID